MSQTQDVYLRPNGERLKLSLTRLQNDVLVDPWPFDAPGVDVEIPATRLPGKPYDSDEQLRAAYASGATEIIKARVVPASP